MIWGGRGTWWRFLLLCICMGPAIGSALAQDPPPSAGSQEDPSQKDSDHKDDDPNPAQAAAEKTKDVTVQAAQATKNAGKAALVKARDWENGWFTGDYLPKNRQRVALTGRQREEIYLQQTLTTPSAYVKRMFAAGIDQARGAPSQWGGGWGGYGERFASREGQFISANSLAALASI